jgi:hypothetical protein
VVSFIVGFTVGFFVAGIDFTVGFIVTGFETGFDLIVGFTVGGSIGVDLIVGFIDVGWAWEITGFIVVGGKVGCCVVGVFVGFRILGLSNGCPIGLDVTSCLDMTMSSTGLRVSCITGLRVSCTTGVIVFGLTEGALVGLFVGLLVTTRRMVGAGVGGDFTNTVHAPSTELKTPRQSPSLTELSNPSWYRSPVPITRYSIKVTHQQNENENEKDKGMSKSICLTNERILSDDVCVPQI